MSDPLFSNPRRQAQYGSLLDLVAPGERIGYRALIDRMKASGHDTDGIGMTLDDLAFRGWNGLWRKSEIVSYREPYFDRENEGNWTEGALYIVRAEGVS